MDSSPKSVVIKRIEPESKTFKVGVFHQHKNSEVKEFPTAQEAEEFYQQMLSENTSNETIIVKEASV